MMKKNDLMNFKMYDVTTWETKNCILLNILRSKGNQSMKFGQLIQCNMGNIFLEKSYAKCDGETILRVSPEK